MFSAVLCRYGQESGVSFLMSNGVQLYTKDIWEEKSLPFPTE